MIRAVLFDNNGTLLDDLELAYGSVVKIFNSYKIKPPTIDQYRQEISADFMKFYYRHGFPETTLAKDLNVIREKYYNERPNEGHFRPDAAKVVLDLKLMKIKVGIVSAEIRKTLVGRLEKVSLLGLIGGDNIWAEAWGDKTPVLLEACRGLKVKPEETVYLDDTVDGTSAAKKAGLIPIAFGNGYNSTERLYEVTSNVIFHLSELIELVKLFNQAGGSL